MAGFAQKVFRTIAKPTIRRTIATSASNAVVDNSEARRAAVKIMGKSAVAAAGGLAAWDFVKNEQMEWTWKKN